MIWDVSPDIFSLGPITIRWYGLLFAASFIVGFYIMQKIFALESKKENDLNDLVWYMILGTVIGARLGHCFFYNPEYYLSNPIKILMVWEGGLASHGAAIGILIAVYLYSKKKNDQTYLWVLDRVVITVALAGFFIRTGNLFNSEIIGKPSDLPWAVVFVNADVSDPMVPRHPAQFYEALAYLLIFVLLIMIYRKRKQNLNDGFIFGLFLFLVFTFRFFVEFIKEDQSAFEAGMLLNMGQILSIPLILGGIALIIYSFRKQQQTGN